MSIEYTTQHLFVYLILTNNININTSINTNNANASLINVK